MIRRGIAATNLLVVLPERAVAVVQPAVRARVTAASTVWPAFVLAISSVLAFAWILHTQLQRLYGLTAPVWDLGQGQQLLWSLANGHGWASSFEEGHNFLGVHLELVLLPIAGVERLWLNPTVPLIFLPSDSPRKPVLRAAA